MKQRIRQYSDLIFGSLLLTAGIYFFVTPCGINFGGVIGIAQIINHLIGGMIGDVSSGSLVGMINFMINIPLFLIALRIMNSEFCVKTMLSLLIQTVLLSVLPQREAPLVEDLLFNCLFGAMICGIGVGYALRGSGCCGGMDIACMCLVKKNPGCKTGKISIYINVVIFAVCLLLFDPQTTMYSIVFVAILYTVSDRFHDQNINIATLIFTDSEQMERVILKEMGRGVTMWNGFGAYTGNAKKILFCLINKYEIHELKEIIHRTDEKAFVTFFVEPMVEGGFEKRL